MAKQSSSSSIDNHIVSQLMKANNTSRPTKKILFQPFNHNFWLLLALPISLLFSTGDNQFLFQIFFFASPLILSFVILKKFEPVSKSFLLLILLWIISCLFKLLGGYFGVSLGRTVIATMEDLSIIAWMILFYQVTLQQYNTPTIQQKNKKTPISNNQFLITNDKGFSQISNLKPKVSFPSTINHQLLTFFFNALVVASVILSLLSFYILIPGVPKPQSGFNLIYAVHGHNHLASLLLFALPYIFIKWLQGEQLTKKIVQQNKKAFPSTINQQLSTFSLLPTAYYLFPLLVAFFLSFARSAFIALPLITLTLLWLYKPKGYKKIALWSLSIMPLIFILTIWLIPLFISPSTTNHQLSTNSWFNRQLLKPLASEGRLDYWQIAWDAFQFRPFLGNGSGTFTLLNLRWRDNPYSETNYAHNIWLEKLSEEGMIGTILFLGIVILLGKNCVKTLNLQHSRLAESLHSSSLSLHRGGDIGDPRELYRGKTNLIPSLTLTILAVFTQSHFDVNLNFLPLKLLFWIFIAILFAYYDQNIKQKNVYSTRIVKVGFYSISIGLCLYGFFMTTSFFFSFSATHAQSNGNYETAAKQYKQAAAYFPFEGKYWEGVINNSRDNQSIHSLLKSDQQIDFFHKEDPLITAKVIQGNTFFSLTPGEKISLYKQELLLNPFNWNHHLQLVKIYSQQKNIDLALYHLYQYANKKIKFEIYQPYPQYKSKITITPIVVQGEWKSEILQKLSSIDIEKVKTPYSTDLGILFYELALTAYENKEIQTAEQLIQLSSYLSPLSADLQLETLNMLFLQKKLDQAEKHLEFCQHFTGISKYCQEFFDYAKEAENLPKVGFLKEKI